MPKNKCAQDIAHFLRKEKKVCLGFFVEKSKCLGSQTSNLEMVLKNGRSLYLDMQATTPLDPRVLDAMMPYMTDAYGTN